MPAASQQRGSFISRRHKPASSYDEFRVPINSGTKALLFSCQDSELLKQFTAQNTRANLFTQLVPAQKHPQESEIFSYFRRTDQNNISPYPFTSHAKKEHPVVPVYPSLCQQTLKWNPIIATASTSQEFVPDIPREYKSGCRCEDCTSGRCPFRISSVNGLKNKLFKDNIVTFCDQCTMTTKVNDAACGICLGVTPIMDTRDIDVNVALPQVAPAVRDCASFTKVDRENRCRPAILKRPVVVEGQYLSSEDSRDPCEGKTQEWDEFNESWPIFCTPRIKKTNNVCQEAVRDTGPGESCRPSKARPCSISKPCSKPVNRYCEMEESMKDYLAPPPQQQMNRVMLYNEGISDSTVMRLPQCASRKPSPTNLNTRSKASVRGRYYADLDNHIPFSHKGNSKYHVACKNERDQSYFAAVGEEPKHAAPVICPRHGMAKARLSCRKPPPLSRPVCISLPKKMLTSEKNIDAFIINGRKYCRADDDDDGCDTCDVGYNR